MPSLVQFGGYGVCVDQLRLLSSRNATNDMPIHNQLVEQQPAIDSCRPFRHFVGSGVGLVTG